MRTIISGGLAASALILAAGCFSTEPAAPTSETPTVQSGTIKLLVSVSGSPEAGPTAYLATIDGVSGIGLQPNSPAELTVLTGDRVVEFKGPESDRIYSFDDFDYHGPTWCNPVAGKKQTVHVPANSSVSITYSVDCPAMIGAGNLVVKVNATGTNIPSEFNVNASRTSGPAVIAKKNVAANAQTTLNVPVGVYSITVNGGSCIYSGATGLFGLVPVLVRDGEMPETSVSMTCH